MDNPAFNLGEMPATAMNVTNEISEEKYDQNVSFSINLNSSENFDSAKNKLDRENGQIEEDSWWIFTKKKKIRSILNLFLKIFIFIFLLYFFLLSLSFLTIGFTLISPYALQAGKAVSFFLQNSFGSLAIGILVTALMQNATVTTSLIVCMVGAGIIPSVKSAIPIIMGSNIGTCLTNILIALTFSGDSSKFKRAFSAAAINDLFNILTTAVLLPAEIFFNLLSDLSEKLIELMPNEANEFKKINFIAAILNPVVDLFIMLDEEQINAVNMGSNNTTKIALRCCAIDYDNIRNSSTCNECNYWSLPMLKTLGDGGTGLVWIIVSLIINLTCLFGIVKIFSQLIEGPISTDIRKIMNASLPGKWKVFNNFLIFISSVALTLIVQSLDIITATLVPLCGLGIISLQRAYVIIIGSNIGTTVTGVLSALTQPKANFKKSIEIAFVYTLFNVFGTLMWFPIPFLKFPKTLAKKFGNTIFKYQWLSYIYAGFVYFIAPLILFSLALIPHWISMTILSILVILLFTCLINYRKLSTKKLPASLMIFSWLPNWIRSFKYWDSFLRNTKLTKLNPESLEKSKQNIKIRQVNK